MVNCLYKKGLVLGIMVLLVGVGSIPSIRGVNVERQDLQGNNTPIRDFNPLGNILYVGGEGPGNYSSIQDAIDYASNGATIFVYDDSSPYIENLVVDKTVNLIGEDRNTTVIDGNLSGDVINISANWVNISGFKIQNCGDVPLANAGVWFSSVNNCTIKRSNFEQCYIGVATYYVNNNMISECFFDNCVIGIYSVGVAASFYDDFSTDTGRWTYYGSATRKEGFLELTPNDDGQCGQIWFDEGIFKNFNVEFDYQIGGLGGGGADGLVCMFCKQTGYTPVDGGSLGFVDVTGNVPGYGIEFDHWYNSDPSSEHIALIKDEVSNHLAWMDDDRVDDDIWHHVKTIVDTNDIYVFIDDMVNPLVIWNGDIDRSFGGFGFTAATGAANAYHRIDNVQISYGCQITNGSQFYNNTIVNSVTGFYMESSGGNHITNNKIVNNCAGINLLDSSGNSFYLNNISNNRYGMGLSHSINNTISNNTVTHNFDDGICLLNTSNNNIITNNSIALNNDNGIYFHMSNNNTLTGNSIKSNDDDGIALHYSSNNIIKVNAISSNYRNGIAFIQSSNNIIIDNTISMNNYDGVYIEDSNINTIIDNTITSNNENGVNLEDTSYNIIASNTISENNEGIYLDDSSSNTIIGNNIISNNNDGIELSQSSSHIITSNNITANNNDGISLYDCDSNTITDNNITANSNYGIEFSQSVSNSITGNNITINNNNGVYLDDSSGNTITHNTINSNNKCGIYLINSSNNKMAGNNITNNYEEGILLWNSSYNNIITSNSITLNNYNGIYFHTSYSNTIDSNSIEKNGEGIELHYSSGNSIRSNIIISNYWDGMYLRNSYGNTITGNTITNNDDGIYLRGSSSNTVVGNNITNNGYWYSGGGLYLDDSSINNIIYHNNLINDESNAVDKGNNTWDDGKYGNYWGDYEERYPNALKIQHMGIWSIHYEIPGGTNKDTCPLLKEWPKSSSKNYIEKQNTKHTYISPKNVVKISTSSFNTETLEKNIKSIQGGK